MKDAHLQNFLSFLKKTLDFPGGGRYNKTRSPARTPREYAPRRSSPTPGAGGSNPFRLFSLLHRTKSAKSMTDFQGAFYRDVQPF